MENQLQKNETVEKSLASINENMGLVDVVRKTIFPDSSKEELQLFFYQCARSGVHPLDKKIIPIKFKDGEDQAGNKTFKISFITTIDHARSKAGDSGQYDGQDEPEFQGELKQPFKRVTGWSNGRPNTEDAEAIVPDTCIVRVYRKDVSRPFVGVARWVEFYPGEKKGQQYIKMPTIMLAKCAEMQAMRKAFPDQLHNLYSEEEMLHVIETMAETTSTGSKPAITENDIHIDESNNNGMPTQEQISQFKLISEAQGKRLYALCKQNKVKPESITNYLKIRSLYWITANKSVKLNYDNICKTVETAPDFFKKYEVVKPEPTKQPEKAQEPAVMGDEDFVALAISTAAAVGLPQDKAEIQMDMEFSFKTFKDVPADKQSMIIDWLSALGDAPGA